MTNHDKEIVIWIYRNNGDCNELQIFNLHCGNCPIRTRATYEAIKQGRDLARVCDPVFAKNVAMLLLEEHPEEFVDILM